MYRSLRPPQALHARAMCDSSALVQLAYDLADPAWHLVEHSPSSLTSFSERSTGSPLQGRSIVSVDDGLKRQREDDQALVMPRMPLYSRH